MPYTIFATAGADGSDAVEIQPGHHRARFSERGQKAARAGVLDDYMIAEVSTLTEARSVLISMFGLNWFNIGRKRLKELAALEEQAEMQPEPATAEDSSRLLDDLQEQATQALYAAIDATLAAHWYVVPRAFTEGDDLSGFTLDDEDHGRLIRHVTDVEAAVRRVSDTISQLHRTHQSDVIRRVWDRDRLP